MKTDRKERIFTPGPVELPESVREVLSRQIIHHRTPEFTESFFETRRLMLELLGEEHDNLVFFASSGTGAMEAAIQNFFREGDRVIAVVGGKFGERWAELGRVWGLEVIEKEVEWGKSVNPEEVIQLVDRTEGCRGVLIQLSESSTGAYHDVRSIGRELKYRDVILVVDAITGWGVYNIKPSEWGIDVLVGGSQKAFMLPPGLSFLWFSEKAQDRLSGRGYYFNVKKEITKQREGQTAFTPAISHILALREVLVSMTREGMERIEEQYRLMSRAMERALTSLGMRIFPENPAISLSTAVPPEGVDPDSLRKELLSLGVRVAGGQGKLKGRIIRISHMGAGLMDMTLVLSALEIALTRMGVNVGKGAGVGEYLSVVGEFL